jgi:hypothetical protein
LERDSNYKNKNGFIQFRAAQVTKLGQEWRLKVHTSDKIIKILVLEQEHYTGLQKFDVLLSIQNFTGKCLNFRLKGSCHGNVWR